jgi:alkanesulfonate monooxygenase SsuD/methylene tetrahydromethanopterin reductase-like flavin-dependent oxidoreductase (luciferase family)
MHFYLLVCIQRSMKFILNVGPNLYKDWEMTINSATRADELGFWGVSLPDHYLWAPNIDDATLDSWFALTYIASKTNRIHVGTIVTPIPFRPPAMLAKMVSTLDVLSKGRTYLGVGAGWSQREFEAYSHWDDARTRVSKTVEGLKLIRALWTEKKVEFQGKYFHSIGGILEPKPVQKPHPPFFFGGFSPRMIKLGGKYGDIVFLPPWIKMSFSEAKDLVMEGARHRETLDKPSLAAGSPVNPGELTPPKYEQATYRNSVEEAERNGCEYFVLRISQQELLESIDDFGRNVIPSYN